MNKPGKCPQCGRPLSADAPGGLCLSCLARLGAAGPPPPTGDETLVLPPTPGGSGTIRYFGDYELLEELGRGGMGVVYRARQVSLDRPVAVKMILAGPYASEEFLLRFRSEAETIAQLRHAGIVGIYEVGEHEGQPYYAMEYVPGPTLAEQVRSGPLPPREAAWMLAAVARAIQHAHDLGVLHRDLKPSNILLDEHGQPHVTDFGVAKRLGDDPGFTLTGQTLGTPAYIPPEQISARRGAVTVRSDVYALGAILYHLLTGRAPFRGETPADALRAVVEQEPPAPRSRNPAIPSDLETICQRCLAKEPARRYASAAALAEDLDRWLEGRPIQARPVRLPERAWLWARRQPALAALSALLSLSLMGGLAGVIWEWRVAEHHRQQAESARGTMQKTSARLQAQEAERLFTAGQGHAAVATLAAALRSDPTDSVLPLRLVSALNQRKWAFPAMPPLADGSRISEAACVPGGERLATLGLDGRLRFWNRGTGAATAPAIPHGGQVGHLEFSHDGSLALSVVCDEAVYLSDPITGHLLEKLALPGGIQHATLHPTNNLVAVGFNSGKLLVFARDTPARQREWQAHDTNVIWVEFSQDGRLLLSASEGAQTRVWSGHEPFTFLAERRHERAIRVVRLSPDGRRLATIGEGGVLTVWKLPSLELLAKADFQGWFNVAEFSPDSSRLLVGIGSGAIVVIEAETGQELLRYGGHTKRVASISCSPDGLTVASSADDAHARIWDLHSGQPLCEPLWHEFWIQTVQFSPDGRQVLTASLDNTARLWELRLAAEQPLRLHDDDGVRMVGLVGAPGAQPAASLVETGDLVTVSRRGAVHSWDARDGRPKRTLREAGGRLAEAVFDPTGRRLVLGETNNALTLLHLETGRALPLPVRPEKSLDWFEFSANGRELAVADLDTVHRFDATTGAVVGTPLRCDTAGSVYGHWIHRIRFGPDGRTLLIACHNAHAQLRDLATGRVLANFAHDGPVSSAEFSPDGSRVLTASFDNTARLWSPAQPATPLQVFRHQDMLFEAIFSPDALQVLASAADGRSVLWDLATGTRSVPPLDHPKSTKDGRFDASGTCVLMRSFDGAFRLWGTQSGLPLGEPFLLGGKLVWLANSRDFTLLAASIGQPEALVWRNPPLPMPAPEWLPLLAEALVGRRVDLHGTEQPISPMEFLKWRERLTALPATNAWLRWAQWFLAPPEQRTLSWDSTQLAFTLPAVGDPSVSLATWRQAARLCPTNAQIVARLAQATLAETNNPCRLREADFLSRRAVELAPDSAEVRRLREVVGARTAGAEPAR
jgi:WD40 repeat protein